MIRPFVRVGAGRIVVVIAGLLALTACRTGGTNIASSDTSSRPLPQSPYRQVEAVKPGVCQPTPPQMSNFHLAASPALSEPRLRALTESKPPIRSRPYPVRLAAFQSSSSDREVETAGTQNLPAPSGSIRLPIESSAGRDGVQLSSFNDRISLTARDAPVNVVLAMIAEQQGLNIVTGEEAEERINVKVTDVGLEDALNAILSINGYGWTIHKDIIIVSKIGGETKTSPTVQGRQVRVFTLNYVTATEVDKVVKGLLSPVGQSFTTQTAPTDQRRTHEQLVVEDLPDYVRRIESYLLQADSPPKQVLIEAHVLQITLEDNCRHGVNFNEIFQLSGTDITIETIGLASLAPPASILRINGGELNSVLDALKSTTDAKTLASPKVAVLNGQEAHMQVGGKIGYLLTTTTQTSTLQSVEFLDIGVILTVTPAITDDGQILMQVKPQVSTGRINPTTQLPESETTEVETRVMLGDGEALVIGGLIKEADSDSQNKIPILGDLWLIGGLFQRREILRERNEIIITLLPRIIPNVPGGRCLAPHEVEQAHTPLLYGPLLPMDRTAFEAKFPTYDVPPHRREKCEPPYPMPFDTFFPVEVTEPAADSTPPPAAPEPVGQFETPPPVYEARFPARIETMKRLPPAEDEPAGQATFPWR